jgi:hypothetical protein
MYEVLVRKPEEKRPLGRHKCVWEDNIKIDINEIQGFPDRAHTVYFPTEQTSIYLVLLMSYLDIVDLL